MALRDLFRRRRPVDTDALDAYTSAQNAQRRARAQGAQLRAKNDQIEERVIRNHFGEALAASWASYREA